MTLSDLRSKVTGLRDYYLRCAENTEKDKSLDTITPGLSRVLSLVQKGKAEAAGDILQMVDALIQEGKG